jgi:hypothetical protein
MTILYIIERLIIISIVTQSTMRRKSCEDRALDLMKIGARIMMMIAMLNQSNNCLLVLSYCCLEISS